MRVLLLYSVFTGTAMLVKMYVYINAYINNHCSLFPALCEGSEGLKYYLIIYLFFVFCIHKVALAGWRKKVKSVNECKFSKEKLPLGGVVWFNCLFTSTSTMSEQPR